MKETLYASSSPWWLRLLQWLLRPLIKIQRVSPNSEMPFDSERPVIYVIEHGGLSNRLLLDRACREAGWPSPSQTLAIGRGKRRPLSTFWLFRMRTRWRLRVEFRERTDRLKQLLTTLHIEDARNVQFVPVSIFVGRGPDRQAGWFRVLFAEHWASIGRLRRLMSLLLNGRATMVQFSKPIHAGDALPIPVDLERSTRKLARLLRFHFRRTRAAAVGPDLSHRRTLIDAILMKPAVIAAIEREVGPKLTRFAATERARGFLWEIAADYSHPIVRSLSTLLNWFWNQIYSGLSVQHFETVKQIAGRREVVYVPCHRSHMDYLLLSYLLYRNGLVPPHIAAGVNLNMPVVGSILRRGGAFFMRRSFKANPLYATVFREYLGELMGNGFSIEYFIEGGRSRSGRLLPPKGGMLTMSVRAYLRDPRRPVVFQPVYFGYEKLIEGKSYLGELSGREKKKESLWRLFKSFGVLRNRYGKVAVNFGEPIELNDLLSQYEPNWRNEPIADDARLPWMGALINDLGDRIQSNINKAADVNPVNLLAVAMLGTPKHAISEDDLIRLLDLCKALVADANYSDRITCTAMSAKEIIAYGEQMGWIRRVGHALGDVLVADGDEGVLLSYFRNNVLHLFATASWVACCFLNNRRLSQQAVVTLGDLVYPFLKAELFLPFNNETFAASTKKTVDLFVAHNLLSVDATGDYVYRPGEGSDAYFALRVIAHSSLQAFQRYYLTVSLLTRNGPRALASAELENLCTLAAQRISLLQELSGPEFFDRGLFRNFIMMLKNEGVVWTDENGKLDFGDRLARIAADAKVVLSRELRHGILKLSNETQLGGITQPESQRVA